jgi:ADP-ribosylglycohydrolase
LTVSLHDRVRGCLLGGAVGDALGAAVEFLSVTQIQARYGPQGITDFASAYGRVGAITDDTQMTLFTAEGLLRADNRAISKGICSRPEVVWHAYLRWLHTQGYAVADSPLGSAGGLDGWLVAVPGLHSLRAPGNTCLSALRGGRPGNLDRPINRSKGCGGVMRMAPAGILPLGDPFDAGCELAALTHGHPSGYLASGFLASLISKLMGGGPLRNAAVTTLDELSSRPRNSECRRAVEAALTLATQGDPSPDKVATLGEGWVGEEALAIALYCALTADGFADGVRLAVNHSGDSDSTGAITGNILGALLGEQTIPERWLGQLELREVVEAIANDLVRHLQSKNDVALEGSRPSIPAGEWERYPGW